LAGVAVAPELKLPQSSSSVLTNEVKVTGLLAGVAKEEPQTLEEGSADVPQALLLFEAVDVVGAGVTHASASNERELEPLFVVEGWEDTVGAGAAAGTPKSNRSPRPAEAETGDGFGGAGAKKPPDAGLETCGAAADFFMPAVRLVNGDGLGGVSGAAGVVFCMLKLKPLKELLNSPNADDCCAIDIDPNPAIVGLCGLGCGFGCEAYSERIDLLRSGREEVIVPGSAVTEEGRGDGDGAGPPKKSSPKSEVESAGLFWGFCAGAAGFIAGASSPKMSRLLALCEGAEGRGGGDDAAAAADFLSSFSWTCFNG
jgi:hypothetical protein